MNSKKNPNYVAPELLRLVLDANQHCLCTSTDGSSVDKLVYDNETLQWA